jgi:hypothetical protein
MTSTDGITWTERTSANLGMWSVTYANNLFVGVGNGVIMTSLDGITWTQRTSPVSNDWRSVTYGNGLFVAVAATGSGDRVITSSDGINWIVSLTPADNEWNDVIAIPNLFVAVGSTGTGNRVMIGEITPQNPICYIGESKVLVQDKETGVESQVCVEDITPEKYLVYSTTQQKFVEIKVNCISGEVDNFILIKKDLLDENKPSEDFYVTPKHPILIKNCEIEAKNIIGAKKVTLEKQKIYTLVTDNREALAINNIDVICWEYKQFMARYKKSKNAVWIENENMSIINK